MEWNVSYGDDINLTLKQATTIFPENARTLSRGHYVCILLLQRRELLANHIYLTLVESLDSVERY